MLSAATVIAKHTSALCNACRVASGRTAEPQDKRHFVQAAKDVANCTAALVKEIKALDADYSEVRPASSASVLPPPSPPVPVLTVRCVCAGQPRALRGGDGAAAGRGALAVPVRRLARVRLHPRQDLAAGAPQPGGHPRLRQVSLLKHYHDHFIH